MVIKKKKTTITLQWSVRRCTCSNLTSLENSWREVKVSRTCNSTKMEHAHFHLTHSTPPPPHPPSVLPPGGSRVALASSPPSSLSPLFNRGPCGLWQGPKTICSQSGGVMTVMSVDRMCMQSADTDTTQHAALAGLTWLRTSCFCLTVGRAEDEGRSEEATKEKKEVSRFVWGDAKKNALISRTRTHTHHHHHHKGPKYTCMF